MPNENDQVKPFVGEFEPLETSDQPIAPAETTPTPETADPFAECAKRLEELGKLGVGTLVYGYDKQENTHPLLGTLVTDNILNTDQPRVLYMIIADGTEALKATQKVYKNPYFFHHANHLSPRTAFQEYVAGSKDREVYKNTTYESSSVDPKIGEEALTSFQKVLEQKKGEIANKRAFQANLLSITSTLNELNS